jgi:predicted transcriptional regulator
MDMSNMLLARKIKKRARYNLILDAMRSPITCAELEASLNLTKNCLTTIVSNLHKEGYVILLRTANKKTYETRGALWQAIKFDYVEVGVDYEYFTRLEEKDEVIASKPIAGLEAKVYRHNAEDAYYRAKYKQQASQARSEYKSPKNYAGVYGVII